MKFFVLLLSVLCTTNVHCQDQLPYSEIPAYPPSYTPGTVAARVIDGLGFRYYWATEGLRDEDLNFKPGAEARSSRETLQHIHTMSYNLVNTTKQIASESSKINSDLSFKKLRKETLLNFEEASNILKANGDKGLEDFNLVFKGENYEAGYPFWNLLNGPIADMLWHVGQVVTFRRSSGNPFNGNMSLLAGREKGK
ncbi:MAG TPA: hypothetical protein VIS49_13635 [Cyclobacteriaceae bacterium]